MLDVMHVEHNMSKSVLKYLFGEKDTLKVCKDLEQAKVMWHLWLHQQDESANYIKPLAPFVFTWNESKAFFNFVAQVHAPIGHVVAFKKHIGLRRLMNMKSHDHHVMVQQIMSASIQNLL